MSKRVFFGTDGIRGKANIYPMTCEMAVALGRAVTYYFQKAKKGQPTIIIGKDTRLSCYMLEQAFSAGVCSQGGRGILTGPLPTPGVAFVTQSMRADAGVMISASHNPYFDNGIKIFDSTGHKLPDEIELELERMLLNPEEIPTKSDGDLGSTKRLDEVIGRYIVQAKSCFDPNYGLDHMRIVVDCAHGAAYKVAPMIFSELGAEVIPLGTNPNGRNINDHSGAMHPQTCAEHVVRFRADLGICLDGDADRLTVVDHLGNVIEGDRVIGLLTKLLVDRGEIKQGGEVVGTIMSNIGLENYLQNLGVKLTRTKVGDRYIVEEMKKNGAIFGGEPSGHMIFKKYATTGDGIIAALKIIECMKFYNQNLNELIAPIPLYPQILRNVEVKSKPALESVPQLVKAQEEAEKELGHEGRVILRYSGTEDKIRVMVEGKNMELISKVGKDLEKVIIKELC